MKDKFACFRACRRSCFHHKDIFFISNLSHISHRIMKISSWFWLFFLSRKRVGWGKQADVLCKWLEACECEICWLCRKHYYDSHVFGPFSPTLLAEFSEFWAFIFLFWNFVCNFITAKNPPKALLSWRGWVGAKLSLYVVGAAIIRENWRWAARPEHESSLCIIQNISTDENWRNNKYKTVQRARLK